MTNTTLLQIFILQSIAKDEMLSFMRLFKLIKNKGVEIKLHSVYNCLKALEKKGYVKSIKTHGKFYRISDLGIDILGKIEYINSLFLAKQ